MLLESPGKYRIPLGYRPASQYLFRDERDIEVLPRTNSWMILSVQEVQRNALKPQQLFVFFIVHAKHHKRDLQ